MGVDSILGSHAHKKETLNKLNDKATQEEEVGEVRRSRKWRHRVITMYCIDQKYISHSGNIAS